MVLSAEQKKIQEDIARIKEEQRRAALEKYKNPIPISQAPKTTAEAADFINKRNTSNSSASTPSQQVVDSAGMSIYIPPEQQARLQTDTQGRVIGVEDPITNTSYAVTPTTVAAVRTQESIRYLDLQKQREAEAKAREAEQRKRMGFVQDATITAAKPTAVNKVDKETQEALKKLQKEQQQPQVIKGFKAGFTATPEQLRGGTVFNEAPSLTEAVGGYAGFVSNAALKAAGIKSGLAVGGAAFSATKGVLTAASGNQLTALVAGGVGATTTGVTVFETSRAIEQTKQNVVLGLGKETKGEAAVFEKARRTEQAGQEGFFNKVGFEFGVSGMPSTFTNAAETELRRQGYKGDELTAALRRLEARRSATQEATFASTLAVGAFSEQQGQLAVNRALGSGASKNFGTYFKAIAPAGFGEGFGQAIISQKNVGDTRTGTAFFTERRPTPVLMFNAPLTRFEEAGISGALGYGVSGGLYGFIGTTAAKGQKTRSAAAETFGYVIDPSEKPSDFLQEIITGSKSGVRVSRGSGTPTLVSAFSSTPTAVPAQTAAQSNVNIMGITPTPVTVTTSSVPAQTPVNILSNTPTNINNLIGVPVDTTTPADTPTDTKTPAQTPVDTFSDTFVNVPVPVFTDKIGALPFIPLPLSFGGGKVSGAGRKKGSRYIDELTISTQIFRQNFFGVMDTPLEQTKRVATKGRKKKATRKPTKSARTPQGFPRPNINFMLFGGKL